MQKYVIETKNISKKYKSLYALQNVDIHVKKGSIYGLIGDNGAGKSTLLKLLAGHSYATSGNILIFGKETEKEREIERQNIGFLIEQPCFFPNLTVEQTLHYYRIQRGIVEKNRVSEMIQIVGLENKVSSKCGKLSLGQKQRLGLAIAMIGNPQILILDEPMNGLDPTGIVEIRSVLKKLNQEKNVTILLSSHILSELQQIATDYGFLSKGTVMKEISASQLKEECSTCVEMSVTDVEQLVALLDTYFPAEQIKVLPDNTIRIFNPKQSPEAYSQIAADHAIYVTRMNILETSLEDYYMILKKGGKE